MRRFIGLILILAVILQICAFATESDNARRYQQAKMLMEIGDYETAARLFEALGNYKDSVEMAARAHELAGGENVVHEQPTQTPYLLDSMLTPNPTREDSTPTLSENIVAVGDTLQFGSYEQDGNTRNGDEPIEWTVLAVKGKSALLLSKYGLDMKPFNTKRTSMTWAECSLRNWLNNDFMYAAFTNQEAEQIQVTDVIAEPNPYYPRVACGESTSDKVFLLSVNELERYLPYETQRFCLPTQYALDRGAHENSKTGRCRWWLRSPGEDSKHAANVFTSGEYWDDYFKVDSSGLTVRPAIWIRM